MRVLEAGKHCPALELDHTSGRKAVEVGRRADCCDPASTHRERLGVSAGDGVDTASS